MSKRVTSQIDKFGPTVQITLTHGLFVVIIFKLQKGFVPILLTRNMLGIIITRVNVLSLCMTLKKTLEINYF